MIRLCLLLASLLLSAPAVADSFKITATGKAHCNPLSNPNFKANASIDMPSPDYGNDGTVWVESIEFRGASYTRSGADFAITGWTEQNKRWFHVSIHGKTKGEKVKGTFHYMPWGSTCFAEGKVR